MCYLKKKLPICIGVILVLILGLFLGISKNGEIERETDGKLHIVATTTMLADLARELGGEEVVVTGLMGAGIDPHLYQASAGDVTKMQEADVVLYQGLHLEGKMGDVFAALTNYGKEVICIEDGLNQTHLLASDDNINVYDPHIWFDVALWKEAAVHVSARLEQIDKANAKAYQANLEQYLAELENLEDYIVARISEVDEEQRVLITAHDAFQYFGKAYGFTVLGLQGISTSAEAGTADVSRLAEYIAENKIKAIFVESSVPPKNVEALQAAVLSRGFETKIGGELYSDSLGDVNSGEDTYILTFRANIDMIVSSLQ